MSFAVKQWNIADAIMKMPENELFTVKSARDLTDDPLFHPSVGNALRRFAESQTTRYGCKLIVCGFNDARLCKRVNTYKWVAIH